ncbi:MAG: hypothetical protein V4546_09620 [Bacteroidota bacterium]
MERKTTALIFLIFSLSTALNAQIIRPNISARVDTTKIEVKKIYHLYTNYLNSRPDSSYKNPNWNKKEYAYYLNKKNLPIDRSVNAMYYNHDAFKSFMKYYTPTVLQIDSIGINLYQIKTIYKANSSEADSSGSSVSYITNIYARRDENGDFKLENTISERTKNWKKIKYKFITYIINPQCKFDKNEAKSAVEFCEKIAKKFDLKILPFKYYILPNSDEFGKLLNFEYWTYYFGAQTNLPLREIFTSYGNENYPHELVHMIFPLRGLGESTPNIISEGLATWLGGPKNDITFENALKEVSKTLKNYPKPTFQDIKSYKIRNQFDNNIFYVSGAVLCKMVYEKKGKDGIFEVYNSTEKTLNSKLEAIFKQPINQIQENVINYLLKQNE